MSTLNATERVGSTRAAYAVIGLVLAGVIIFAGNYDVSAGENGGTGLAIATAVIVVVLTAVLFELVLPRTQATGRAVLLLGVLSFLTLAAFWSGVPAVLAAATWALASRHTGASKQVTAGRVLAVVAALAATVVSVVQLFD